MEEMEVLLQGLSGRRGGILRYQPELRTESFLSRWDPTGFHGRGNDMGASIHSLRSNMTTSIWNSEFWKRLCTPDQHAQAEGFKDSEGGA